MIATILLCGLLAIAAFFAARLVSHFHPAHASTMQQRNADLETQPTRAMGQTNPGAGMPEGFYVGKGDQRVFIKYATPDPVLRSVLESAMTSGSDPNAKGREMFGKLCGICHQPDGEGKEGVAPPLVGSEWALSAGGERSVRIVLNGVTGPLRVRGRVWNLPMPPWRQVLNDDQVAVVLTYIRTQLGTNHAGPISAETVAAARKELRLTPETSDDLLRLSDQ